MTVGFSACAYTCNAMMHFSTTMLHFRLFLKDYTNVIIQKRIRCGNATGGRGGGCGDFPYLQNCIMENNNNNEKYKKIHLGKLAKNKFFLFV